MEEKNKQITPCLRGETLSGKISTIKRGSSLYYIQEQRLHTILPLSSSIFTASATANKVSTLTHNPAFIAFSPSKWGIQVGYHIPMPLLDKSKHLLNKTIQVVISLLTAYTWTANFSYFTSRLHVEVL